MRTFVNVFTIIIVGYLVIVEADVYQPECDSFQNAVDAIHDNQQLFLNQVPLQGAGINCTKSPDCDGLQCLITIANQRAQVTIKLHPCTTPAQLYIVIQNLNQGDTFFEQTLSHGDSIPIPGVTYQYLFLELSTTLDVTFVKVEGGFKIGMGVSFWTNSNIPLFSIPIFPETMIQTADCTATDMQCPLMRNLLDNLIPPQEFVCISTDDCKGFNCSGPVELTQGLVVDISSNLFVDSCTDPVSYVITVESTGTTEVWQHVFTHSQLVYLDLPLPPDFTASLDVTMNPNPSDIDFIETTLILSLCLGSDCRVETIANDDLVPVPPCGQPMTTVALPTAVTPPPPIHGSADQCVAMRHIAGNLTGNEYLAPGALVCHSYEECNGFACTLTENSLWFSLTFLLHHCASPVYANFTVYGIDNDYYTTARISQPSTVNIDGIIQDGQLKFSFVAVGDSSVELAMGLRLPSYIDGMYSTIPLIQDQLIPIPACGVRPPTTVTKPMMTTTGVRPPTTVTKPMITTTGKSNDPSKTPTIKGKENGTKKQTGPNNEDNTSSNQATVIGVTVVSVVIVAAIIAAVAFFLIRKRRLSEHVDEVGLVTTMPPLV